MQAAATENIRAGTALVFHLSHFRNESAGQGSLVVLVLLVDPWNDEKTVSTHQNGKMLGMQSLYAHPISSQ